MLRLTGALAAAAAAAAVAPVADGSPAACGSELVARLTGPKTSQLVLVVAAGPRATWATVRLWQKAEGCWRPAAGPWPARVGRNGVAVRRREGDGTTPAGVFGFGRVLYGVGPNPGVRYPYRRVVCGDWWVEDPRSPYYNRLRHFRCGARPPWRQKGDDLAASPRAYRHFAFIRYNDPPAPGLGSGIFLHASTGGPTQGCVTLSLPQLVKTLRWLRPAAAPLIALGTRGQLARFQS